MAPGEGPKPPAKADGQGRNMKALHQSAWYLIRQDAFSAESGFIVYQDYERTKTEMMQLCAVCGFPTDWGKFDLTGFGMCTDCSHGPWE